jgi:radical SAM superfamily enzyme YgiQ (UPF0313 family)
VSEPRVLLVNTNREHAPQPVMPVGLCLLASAVEARGFRPRLLDLCFSRRPERDLMPALQEWRPAAIGLGIRNLDNGDSLRPREYLPAAAALAHLCRAHSAAPLIIGGPAVSIAPARLLEVTGADYAVVGDGEQALPDLLDCLTSGQSPSGIPGVWSGEETAPARVADLNALAPARPERWLDLGRYLRRGAALPVQTRRGCDFACTYCTYRRIEGQSYRVRSPEAVAEEVAEAARLGVRQAEVVDATFNRPAEHALAVCEAIIRAGAKVHLQAAGINPAGVTKELLMMMRLAGFTTAICSVDSGSGTMLERLRKGFAADDIGRMARWSREVGLSVLWMFMFGSPGESEATVRETLACIATELCDRDRVIAAIGVRVYPDTELAREALAEGEVTPETDLSRPVFYFSPQLAPGRVLELLDASPRRAQITCLETLQQPLVAWAARAKSALHLPGPLWSAIPLHNRFVRHRRRGIQ